MFGKVKSYIFSMIDYSNIKSVLDIGCGRGDLLIEMGEQLGKNATLVGIDSMKRSIDHAVEKTSGDERFSFKLEDIETGLGFCDNTFDIVLCNDVLECIKDQENLLKETYRVLKPGGQVIFSHYDWDTQVFNVRDKNLYRKILHTFNDWQQPWMTACDPWMGRKLHGLFNRAGLFDGEVSVYVLTETDYELGNKGYYAVNEEFIALVNKELISEEEFIEFRKDVQEHADRGEYFYSINVYFYNGIKK